MGHVRDECIHIERINVKHFRFCLVFKKAIKETINILSVRKDCML